MHGKKKAVQRKQRLESMQKVGLDCVVGGLLDWAPWHSLCDYGRQERHRILLQECKALGIRSSLSLRMVKSSMRARIRP